MTAAVFLPPDSHSAARPLRRKSIARNSGVRISGCGGALVTCSSTLPAVCLGSVDSPCLPQPPGHPMRQATLQRVAHAVAASIAPLVFVAFVAFMVACNDSARIVSPADAPTIAAGGQAHRDVGNPCTDANPCTECVTPPPGCVPPDTPFDPTLCFQPPVCQSCDLCVVTTQTVAFTSVPPNPALVGGTYSLSATATYSAQGFPAIFSSLTTSVCSVSGSVATLLSVGTCTVAADQPGDGAFLLPATQVTQSFPVTSSFNGFFAPIANAPAVNAVTAGSAVPIKFSLGGFRGLDILASGSPSSVQINCSTAVAGSSAVATTEGKSTLSYNPIDNTYTFAWATNAAWKNTCRRLTVALKDGSSHAALFSFR